MYDKAVPVVLYVPPDGKCVFTKVDSIKEIGGVIRWCADKWNASLDDEQMAIYGATKPRVMGGVIHMVMLESDYDAIPACTHAWYLS